MIKLIKKYKKKLESLSMDDLVISHKLMKRYFFNSLWIVFGFIIIYNLLELIFRRDFSDIAHNVIVVLCSIPGAILLLKIALIEDQIEVRERDLPYDFESKKDVYEKQYKIGKWISALIGIPIIASLIILRFVQWSNELMIAVVFLGIIMFMDMRVFELKRHIRRNYLRYHPEDEE